MIALGLNAYHYDLSACLLVDGQLLAAAEEERFRRIKHWAGFPFEAIRYCFSECGVAIDDIDHIAVNRNPKAHLLGKALFAFRNQPWVGLVKGRLKNALSARQIKDKLA